MPKKVGNTEVSEATNVTSKGPEETPHKGPFAGMGFTERKRVQLLSSLERSQEALRRAAKKPRK